MTDRSATATPVMPSPRRTVLPGEGADWTPPGWDDVVRDHGDRVYRLAYRLTGNQHDAEDLTQETFIRVFRSLCRLQARHLRGLAAPDHHEPLPGHGPPPRRGSGWRRCPRTRTGSPAASRRPSRSSPTPTWTRPAGGPGRLPRVPGRGRAVRRRGPVVRGDRGHPRGEARHGASRIHRGGPRCGRAGAAWRCGPGGRDEGRSGGRRMTGSRRFSLSSPDWGQAHLSLDAIVAYVDDELVPVPTPAPRPTSTVVATVPREVGPRVRPARPCVPQAARACRRRCCGACGRFRSRPSCPRCRPVSVSPRTGSSSCCAMSRGPIPVRARHLTSTTCTLPPAPGCPRQAWARPGRGAAPVLPPRADGCVSGIALSALAVGALAAPGSTPEPVAPSGVLGGVLMEVPPQLSPPSADVSVLVTTVDDPSAAPWRTRRSSMPNCATG